MTRRLFIATAVFAIVLSATAADLSTLTGKKFAGEIVSVVDGVVTFRTTAGPVGVAVKDVFVIDFGIKIEVPAKDAKYDEIELIDGSVLRCTDYKIKDKTVEVTLLAGPSGVTAPTIALPMDNLFAVVKAAHDPKGREEWRKLLLNRGKRDLLVIRKEEGLSPVPGTILSGDETGTAIIFERESNGQKDTFKLTRATGGLVFNQQPRGIIPPTMCKLFDAFGNVFTVQSLNVVNGGYAVKTVSGATIEYRNAKGVAKLDFSQGNISYLSDMEPTVTAPPPVAGEPNYTYLRDKTPDGPGMKLGGVGYAKGLWLAPDTAVAFKLNGEFREFKTVLGIDDSIQVASSAVRIVIDADGKSIFNEIVSRKVKPRELTLDVKGMKQLKISVEAEGLFLGNQINLAEARLQK